MFAGKTLASSMVFRGETQITRGKALGELPRLPLGLGLQGNPLPSADRQWASEPGGGGKVASLNCAGNRGGCCGAGGMLLLFCWEVFDVKVRVYSSAAAWLSEAVENSQQGRTIGPDGATSIWKVSVPGGVALAGP